MHNAPKQLPDSRNRPATFTFYTYDGRAVTAVERSPLPSSIPRAAPTNLRTMVGSGSNTGDDRGHAIVGARYPSLQRADSTRHHISPLTRPARMPSQREGTGGRIRERGGHQWAVQASEGWEADVYTVQTVMDEESLITQSGLNTGNFEDELWWRQSAHAQQVRACTREHFEKCLMLESSPASSEDDGPVVYVNRNFECEWRRRQRSKVETIAKMPPGSDSDGRVVYVNRIKRSQLLYVMRIQHLARRASHARLYSIHIHPLSGVCVCVCVRVCVFWCV